MKRCLHIAIYLLFGFTSIYALGKYKGGRITLKDLPLAKRLAIYKAEKSLYDLKKQTLIYEVLRREANKSGKSFRKFTYELYEEGKKSKVPFADYVTKKYSIKMSFREPVPPKFKIAVNGSPYWGKRNSNVVVVEFSDLECPYCRKYQQAIQNIRKKYELKIKWVFKDFPLSFHKNASQAHIAAYCAEKENKYFEYQTKVFEQGDLSTVRLNQIAKELSLNIATFQNCVKDKDGKLRKKIEKNIKYGAELGVNGTPALYINNRQLSGLRSYEELSKAIDEALAKTR